jgi:hypothetical protein
MGMIIQYAFSELVASNLFRLRDIGEVAVLAAPLAHDRVHLSDRIEISMQSLSSPASERVTF